MFIYKLMVHSEDHKDKDEKTAKIVTKEKEEISKIDKMKADESWYKLNRKEKNEILAKEGKEFI